MTKPKSFASWTADKSRKYRQNNRLGFNNIERKRRQEIRQQKDAGKTLGMMNAVSKITKQNKTKQMNKIQNTEKKIEQFAQSFQNGMAAWREAGEILVELVEDDPRVYDAISEKYPTLTSPMLQTLEKIGRGLLLPTLAMDTSLGGTKLKSLPLSVQRRYDCEAIPVIVETEHGIDTLRINAKSLTREQVYQVFDGQKIRSEGEQRAWLVDKRSRKTKEAKPLGDRWTIKNGRVSFAPGAILSIGDMAKVMAQLTK